MSHAVPIIVKQQTIAISAFVRADDDIISGEPRPLKLNPLPRTCSNVCRRKIDKRTKFISLVLLANDLV